MLARASSSLHAQAQKTGSLSRPLEEHYRLSCSRAPLVLSARDHDERGILLVLLRIIPVCPAHAGLPLSPCVSTINRVFFSSSWESSMFVLLVRASCSLRAQAQWTGYSSRPLENHSRLSCSLFWDGQIWSPNFAPVTKIQLWGCKIICYGAQLPCNAPHTTR